MEGSAVCYNKEAVSRQQKSVKEGISMKFVSLVFSPTGGTQKAAGALTAGWQGPAQQLDLTRMDFDGSAAGLTAGDLVLIAVPSFAGRVPALAAQRLAGVRGNGACCAVLAVYGNRAYEDTLAELYDLAVQCGFRVIAGVSAVAEHSIMHCYAAGRPDARDRAELQAFGRRILEKARRGDTAAPQLPGNRPYKQAGAAAMVPAAGAACTGCGLCAEKCPAGAIPREAPAVTDAARCIYCMRCVSICPQHARHTDAEKAALLARKLQPVCQTPKTNELFL